MITVTAVSLANLAPKNQPLADTALILAAKQGSNSSRLVICDWADNISQQTAITKVNLAKAYQNTDKSFIAFDKLTKNEANQDLLLMATAQLKDYFFGRRQAFDLPIDISFGTAFQKRVWQALQSIAFGQTISYTHLAHLIGNPKAYRAAANANGKNPLSIIIPCHRVIAHDGSIGGYTGGVDKKRYLLNLEGNFCKT